MLRIANGLETQRASRSISYRFTGYGLYLEVVLAVFSKLFSKIFSNIFFYSLGLGFGPHVGPMLGAFSIFSLLR